MIPRIRFNEFNGDWVLIKLDSLLEFKNGINASKEQYGTGVKFINVLDILNNDYLTNDRIIGRVDVAPEIIEKNKVSYGDILFQRSSETREDIGSACVYLDKEHSATFGGFVIRGKKIGDYNPVFFNKLLKTDLSRNEMKSKSGGSTRYNIGQDILSSIELPFPSIDEQSKIATFLTSIDGKLNHLKKKKTLLEKYKKGMMQKIFTQEVRFRDEDKEFEKWIEIKLNKISKIYDGTHMTPTYV
ncbi:MAG: restriction endonuclease subunit S, partial [Flavobacterium sp.]